MAFEITKVEVWEGRVIDRPGALSEQLAEVMRAGANLDMIMARPCPLRPDECTLVLGPLHGEAQTTAAEQADLHRSGEHWLRLEGPDRPWLAAGISRTVADSGVNIKSMTGTVLGDRCVVYISFATEADARRAAQVLTPVLG
ncbi:MAG: hypothetical protein PVJ57_07275 [Phycisphaerae bacterium]|jgi:hypothetical protein